MQQFLSWREAEAMLLAEANITMDQADEFFGSGDRLHVIFNFPLNQKLFLAFARGEATPVADFLRNLPPIPLIGQWATFLRNHDEIDLGRLEPDEKAEVFAAFGPDESMQLYERGLRRRLAPMLGGDERRIAMGFSLMLSLPGTPVIWYGDEIGMGENLALNERDSVRLPMQWNARGHGGFSSADPKTWVRVPEAEGPFTHRFVNAETQRTQPDSLFSTIQKLIRVRRGCREIGWSQAEVLETEDPAVLMLRAEWKGGTVLTLHNLADRPVTVDIGKAIGANTQAHDLLKDARELRQDAAGRCMLRLPAFGYEWLRIADRTDR